MGIIIAKDSVSKLHRCIHDLQDLVGDDYEDSVLHGEAIKAGQGIFGVLRTDPSIKEAWDKIVFSILGEVDFKICSVVIDKAVYRERYGDAALHPYHYCLNLLVAGYLGFLERRSARGDIMAESRGRKEDRPLVNAFASFYAQGNQHYSVERIQRSITSKNLKIKTKDHCIPGLILADLIALAVKLDILREEGAVEEIRDNFVRQIINRIPDKYVCFDDPETRDFCKKLI